MNVNCWSSLVAIAESWDKQKLQFSFSNSVNHLVAMIPFFQIFLGDRCDEFSEMMNKL